MHHIHRAVALASLAMLTACAYPSPQHVQKLNAFIGKSEADLVRGYGVPTRTYETGGVKFLAYNMSRIDTIPGDGFGYGGFGYGGFGYGGFGYGGGLGYGGPGYDGFGGFGPEIVQRDCSTTFELKNATVQSWSLRGNDC